MKLCDAVLLKNRVSPERASWDRDTYVRGPADGTAAGSGKEVLLENPPNMASGVISVSFLAAATTTRHDFFLKIIWKAGFQDPTFPEGFGSN